MNKAKSPATKPATPTAKPAAATAKPATATAKPATATAKPAAKKPQTRTEPLCARLNYAGGFPVYLSRYVLTGGDKPRAAMRFFNASDIVVTGLRFRLYEKDASGKVIADYSLERTGLFAEQGEEFAVADTNISKACVSVEVKLESVISSPYEYVVKEDGVKINYGAAEREPEYFFRKQSGYSVKKSRKKYTVISIAAVLAAVLLTAFTVWRLGVLDRFLPEDIYSAENNTTFVDGDAQC